MTNQQQQQHIDPINRSAITSSSAYEDSTINSSTTTFHNSNGTSSPTPIPTLPSSSLTSDTDTDIKTFDEVDHRLEKGDHRRGSDPNSEEPLSRRGSLADEVVMESGFRGYLVVFGGFLIILAFIGYVSIYGIFQSKYNDIYGAQGKTPSAISFVGSLASGFQFGFTIITGPIMNRFGHKIVLWSGCIIASLGLLLASWCTELWQVYLTQGVMFGIGASFLNMAATAIPPLWYDKNRGLAMGICFCGAGVGGLIFGFAIPALINTVDIYWTLRIFAIFHFVCTAFAAIVMRAPRQLSGPPVEIKRDVMNWSLMKDRGFMLWFLTAALFGFAYVIPFAYVPSFAKDVIGLDPNIQGGQLLAIMSGANAIGRILIGFAGDRLGAIPVAAVSFMATGACCFIWMFATTHGALIGFSIVYGFFSGTFFTMIASITANIVGLSDLGSGLTIIYLVNTPGNLFTMPIAGKIFEQAGNYKAMIGYNAAMWFAGGLALFALLAYNHYTKRVPSV
ncbi:hypothetical protein BGX24_012153 [Mortierella sp. AD032]|nr:hypothetical protein BGX24_012153 [Mortierella sp. AD032]